MNIDLLFKQPWLFLVFILAFLVTLAVHEASHALVSTLLGDSTAKREGRLTLNPFSHVDIMGFVALVLVGFGWGKPVPFNPYNLKYQKWGPTFVAVAGPVSNLVFGTASTLLAATFQQLLGWTDTNLLVIALSFIGYLNYLLMIFNLIPLPPLDGSKVLLALLSDPAHAKTRQILERQGTMLLLMLIVLDSVAGLGIFSWIGMTAQWLVHSVSGILL